MTFKRGGSVKSGPTVFFYNYRHQGYGQLLRTQLHDYLKKKGFRKIYCTATVVNRDVVNYLLEAGYKVECQLERQYGIFDELVLGKILIPTKRKLKKIVFSGFEQRKPTYCGRPVKSDKEQTASFIKDQFSEDIVAISTKVAKKFTLDSFRNIDLSYEQKPKTLLISKRSNSIVAACICLPKRGGSFKAVLLSEKQRSESLTELLKCVEKEAQRQNRKKIYFTVPEHRIDHLEQLRNSKYHYEGTLIEPYTRGINVHILSKIFRSKR